MSRHSFRLRLGSRHRKRSRRLHTFEVLEARHLLAGEILFGNVPLGSEANAHAHGRDVAVEVGQYSPTDPLFFDQWYLHNTGHTGGSKGADIDARNAFGLASGSYNVVIPIIDSGVDPTHPDIYSNIWINQGEIPDDLFLQLSDIDGDSLITLRDLNDGANASFTSDFNQNGFIDIRDVLADPNWMNGVDDEGNGYVDDVYGWDFVNDDNDPFDDAGHGTFLAGLMGGMHNDVFMSGINGRMSIMSLKFLDSEGYGFTADAIDALDYARVMKDYYGYAIPGVNLSWGGDGFNEPLRTAIETLGQSEILVIAGAGNGDSLGYGLNNDFVPYYPASYELGNVIAVSATDHNDNLASFSNYGMSVDVAAPGDSVLSIEPDFGVDMRNGTSIAAAITTAVVALKASLEPGASMQGLANALMKGVDLVASLEGRIATGGRVNAFNTMQIDATPPSADASELGRVSGEGTRSHRFTIAFTDNRGLSLSSIDGSEVVVTSRDGLWAASPRPIELKNVGNTLFVTYELGAPDHRWDALENGIYDVDIIANQVLDEEGNAASADALGSFLVVVGEGNGFSATAQLPTPSHPISFATGDFVKDGNIDLVSLSGSADQINVLAGVGNGTFGLSSTMSAGQGGANSIVADDFDNDQRVDIATSNQWSGDLLIYRGNDDGSFASPIAYEGGDFPTAVETTDLNLDGFMDVLMLDATGDWRDGNVLVYLGQPDGTLAAPNKYPVGDRPGDLIHADFNVDGYPDLAVTELNLENGHPTEGNVFVLYNKGDGKFSGPTTVPVGRWPLAIVASDFSSDGLPDLAVLNTDDREISILLNQGRGKFERWKNIPTLETGTDLAAADYNHDGKIDLAVTGSSQVEFYLSSDSSLFDTSTQVDVGSGSQELLVADIDADGMPDIATVDHHDGTISLVFNDHPTAAKAVLDTPKEVEVSRTSMSGRTTFFPLGEIHETEEWNHRAPVPWQTGSESVSAHSPVEEEVHNADYLDRAQPIVSAITMAVATRVDGRLATDRSNPDAASAEFTTSTLAGEGLAREIDYGRKTQSALAGSPQMAIDYQHEIERNAEVGGGFEELQTANLDRGGQLGAPSEELSDKNRILVFGKPQDSGDVWDAPNSIEWFDTSTVERPSQQSPNSDNATDVVPVAFLRNAVSQQEDSEWRSSLGVPVGPKLEVDFQAPLDAADWAVTATHWQTTESSESRASHVANLRSGNKSAALTLHHKGGTNALFVDELRPNTFASGNTSLIKLSGTAAPEQPSLPSERLGFQDDMGVTLRSLLNVVASQQEGPERRLSPSIPVGRRLEVDSLDPPVASEATDFYKLLEIGGEFDGKSGVAHHIAVDHVFSLMSASGDNSMRRNIVSTQHALSRVNPLPSRNEVASRGRASRLEHSRICAAKSAFTSGFDRRYAGRRGRHFCDISREGRDGGETLIDSDLEKCLGQMLDR